MVVGFCVETRRMGQILHVPLFCNKATPSPRAGLRSC